MYWGGIVYVFNINVYVFNINSILRDIPQYKPQYMLLVGPVAHYRGYILACIAIHVNT